ncbi:glycosyltransferase [Aeromonas enterica]
MKKILNIYTLGKIGDRLGGPMAYLFNLKSYFESINESSVDYLDFTHNVKKQTTVKGLLVSKIAKIMPNIMKAWYFERQAKILVESKVNYIRNNIDKVTQSDILFCHSTIDCYAVNKVCTEEGINKKIVLTSHTPVPFSYDIFIKLNDVHHYKFNSVLRFYKNIDILAYKCANKIFFPCDESFGIYSKYLPELKEIDIKNKIDYLATGINLCKPIINSSEFKEKYGISIDSVVVSYIGKRNSIKGFDRFIKLHKEIMNSPLSGKVTFVLAGNGPMEAPKGKEVIDIGWTKDPFSIINASDYFVLANRETYFDLIALEVLSLGTKLLASNNGGNCHLYKVLGNDCVNLFSFDDDYNKLIDVISSHESYSKNDVIDKFRDNFSMEKFAQNYLKKVC